MDNKSFVYCSTTKGFVFIRMPKTGSTSVMSCVRPYLNEKLLKNTNPKYSVYGGLRKHMPAKHVRDVLADSWNDMFKFAFVRNPYDQIVSVFHHLKHEYNRYPDLINPRALSEFDFFLDYIIDNFPNWVMPSHLLLDENNKLLVDFLGKYENLEKDWEFINDKLKLNCSSLHKKNKSNKKRLDYMSYYCSYTKSVVKDKLRLEFDYFGYAP